MSQEIVSRLGFDVSEALQALDNLDTKLRQVGQTMQQFGNITKDAGRLGSHLDKFGGAFTSNMDAAAKSTEKLTVSWGMMARIVTTQLIVRALSQMRRTFEETAESAIDFQRQVALIRTIDDSGASFDQVAASVRNLSDAYNIPLLDAAAGSYQAISNQVGTLAESLEFTADAAQFAKATGSSLKDSVDLLSGAMASYGLGVEDTEKVSGIFFSVIDKGRINASELANTFGRLGPLAAQAGVSLEDLGGALSAVSVKGSKTSESLTMVRGILNSLQKPTPELIEQFQKMGFSSTEAALATLHLDGVLRELAKSAGGSSQQLAKYFTDIRARAGAASLISDFQTLADDIEAARKAGANFAQEKWLTATATDAEKVTAELNKLKNAMTVDLGQSVLKAANDLSQFVGGAENVIQVAKASGPALIGAGAGFLTLRASMAAAKLEAMGLAKALGALALVPVAIGAGTSIGQYIGSEMTEQAFANLKKLDEENAKSVEEFKRQQSEKRDAAGKADDARVQSALRVIQSLNTTYLNDLANFKQRNEALVKTAKAGLDDVLKAREEMVDQLSAAIKKADDMVKSSQQRMADLQIQRADIQFEGSIGWKTDPQKAFALFQQAEAVASEAASALAKATDQEQVDRALTQFGRAEGFAEQAKSIAERVQNRSMEARAASVVADIVEKQIAAEKQLQALQKSRVPALEAERDSQQAVVDMMREQIDLVLKNMEVGG